MISVYVLKSKTQNWFYVGLTHNSLRRLKQHNKGQVRSTKAYKPFLLIYEKGFETSTKARDYEKYLKIKVNKERLLSKLGYRFSRGGGMVDALDLKSNGHKSP